MDKIVELSSYFNNAFAQQIFAFQPQTLYEPVRHILGIHGKKIRPLLVLIANDAFGGNKDDAINAAIAIEVFHNFTLVHDDIMDQAAVRRSVPTVHTKFGVNNALLAGDVMLIHAYRYLCRTAPEKQPEIMDCFNTTGIQICEGQQLDVDFEERTDVTIADYLQMIKYKTSVLLACSLKIGAIIGGADTIAQHELYDFGINLGLSFQIKDDWLDTFGAGEKVGKKIGGDILQNKKTYLLLSAIQAADTVAEINPILAMEKNDAKIAAMMAVYEKYAISEKTLEAAEAYYQAALQNLQSLDISDEKKAVFYQLAEMIQQRNF